MAVADPRRPQNRLQVFPAELGLPLRTGEPPHVGEQGDGLAHKQGDEIGDRHPSLQFKKVHTREPIYSARISLGWRVLGLLDGNTIHWF